MMRPNKKNIILTIFITSILCSLEWAMCSAEGRHQRHRKITRPLASYKEAYGHYEGELARSEAASHAEEGYTLQAESTATAPEQGLSSPTFNVLAYGAKGDGKADDTNAFEQAWQAACKQEGSTMLVPSGSVFLVKPISFSGPNCQPHMVFQLDGKIIAPTGPESWGSGLLQWIEFTKLIGIAIQGNGTIDGQGSVWWNNSPMDNPVDQKLPKTKPTALRFYGSTDVTVTGITIQNSPQTHLKFDSCTGVQVSDLSVSSPGDSPNTDGIHLQNSKDVAIHSTNLACGDDCISIQSGSTAVYIHNVNCGPGHGISIGGLGKGDTKACVSNITVSDSILQNTMTGVRIKTWQGGSGMVQGVMFSNIQVYGVETPIMIDQFYCDGGKCHNQTSAVAVAEISYQFIKGTYTSKPVHFACSDSLPCTGVTLAMVELKPLPGKQVYDPFCWETYGELKTSTTPRIDCLKATTQPQKIVESC